MFLITCVMRPSVLPSHYIIINYTYTYTKYINVRMIFGCTLSKVKYFRD
jgi:hypothetical protein